MNVVLDCRTHKKFCKARLYHLCMCEYEKGNVFPNPRLINRQLYCHGVKDPGPGFYHPFRVNPVLDNYKRFSNSP